MNKKVKDKIVECALNDLIMRDIQECCLNGKFDAAETIARMVMSESEAKKLVIDLCKIIDKSKLKPKTKN
jgi:hypothetical protein